MGAKAIEVIGHRVSEGIKGLQEENVRKIEGATRPKTKKQVRAFIGLTGYYRDFIPNYAAKAEPLTDLTKKGQPNKVSWEQPQENAFVTLKRELASESILHLPDSAEPFVLRTDASDVGIGAVLMQVMMGNYSRSVMLAESYPRENASTAPSKENVWRSCGRYRSFESIFTEESLYSRRTINH